MSFFGWCGAQWPNGLCTGLRIEWAVERPPGARFSKVPKSFRTRKATAKSQTLLLLLLLLLLLQGPFHSRILNVNRSSLYTKSFRRIQLFVFKYRLTKNGSEGPKSFRDFWEMGPWFEPWPESLRCGFWQDNLLSSCLSPPRHVNESRLANCLVKMTECWGVACVILASHSGGSNNTPSRVILLKPG